MMITAEELDLIARHLRERNALEAEEARLLALPPPKQKIVLDRLHALDRYLALPQQTAADAARLAQTLKMSERNFYRLVSKLRERGPVAALAPNYRVRQRSSVATEGLGEVAEAALADLLRSKPDARWKQVMDVVRGACARAPVDPPSPAAIRRRLVALRAGSDLVEADRPTLGVKWLMDQTAISLPIRGSDGPRYAVVTLLVDRETRLIAGGGCASEQQPRSGLVAALGDALDRLPSFASAPVELAPTMREFSWVIPEDVAGVAGAFTMSLVRHVPYTTVDTSGLGPRRHGEALFRLLGDRLGPYKLVMRATAEPSISNGGDGVAPVAQEKAEALVRHAIDQWNESVLSRMDGKCPSKRAQADRRRRLKALSLLLVDIFEPVLDDRSVALLQQLKGGTTKDSGAARPE